MSRASPSPGAALLPNDNDSGVSVRGLAARSCQRVQNPERPVGSGAYSECVGLADITALRTDNESGAKVVDVARTTAGGITARTRAENVRFVALDRQHARIEEELKEAFARLLESSAFTLGSEVERFEAGFRRVLRRVALRRRCVRAPPRSRSCSRPAGSAPAMRSSSPGIRSSHPRSRSRTPVRHRSCATSTRGPV